MVSVSTVPFSSVISTTFLESPDSGWEAVFKPSIGSIALNLYVFPPKEMIFSFTVAVL